MTDDIRGAGALPEDCDIIGVAAEFADEVM